MWTFALNFCEATRIASPLQPTQAQKKMEILAPNSHTSVRFDWTYHFFFSRKKKPRSRFWLARTYVRMKTYDGACPWVFLSMYIMNFWKHIFDRQQLTWSRVWAEYKLHENLDTLLWTAMYFGKTFTTSLAINRDNN